MAVSPDRTCEIKQDKDMPQEFLIFEENSVLLKLPSGKPNRKNEAPARVSFEQKGHCCLYYGIKLKAMLSENYLKEQNLPVRKKISSLYRKPITHLSKYKYIKQILSRFIGTSKNPNFKFTEAHKSKLIAHLNSSLLTLRTAVNSNNLIEEDGFVLTFEDIQKFIDNFKNSQAVDILEFADEEQIAKMVDLNITFLKEMGQNPETTHNASMLQKAHYLRALSDKMVLNAYDLKTSDWKPSDNIDVLIKILKEKKSPLLMAGLYGHDFYKKPCINVDGSGYYSVWGWPKGSHTNNLKEQNKQDKLAGGHVIDVIGAERILDPKDTLTKEFVYFVDPSDLSEPSKKRKIYKISYEQFCNLCFDNEGYHLVLRSDKDKSVILKDLNDNSKRLSYGWQ